MTKTRSYTEMEPQNLASLSTLLLFKPHMFLQGVPVSKCFDTLNQGIEGPGFDCLLLTVTILSQDPCQVA